jgi:hypothetical protein
MSESIHGFDASLQRFKQDYCSKSGRVTSTAGVVAIPELPVVHVPKRRRRPRVGRGNQTPEGESLASTKPQKDPDSKLKAPLHPCFEAFLEAFSRIDKVYCFLMKHSIPPTSSAIERILQQSPRPNSEVDFSTIFPDPLGRNSKDNFIPSCAVVVAMIASAVMPAGSLSLAWVPKMEQPKDPFALQQDIPSDPAIKDGISSGDIELVFEKNIMGYSKLSTEKRFKRLSASLHKMMSLDQDRFASFSTDEREDPLQFWPKLGLDLPGAFGPSTQPQTSRASTEKRSRKRVAEDEAPSHHKARKIRISPRERGLVETASTLATASQEAEHRGGGGGGGDGEQPSERISSIISGLKESTFYVDQIVFTHTCPHKAALFCALSPKLKRLIPQCLLSVLMEAMGKKTSDGGDDDDGPLFYAHQAEVTFAFIEPSVPSDTSRKSLMFLNQGPNCCNGRG